MKKITLLACGIVASLAAQAIDMDFLDKLIAIPSDSENVQEVNRATRLTRDYLAKRGLFCTIETMESGREVLYAATTPGKCHDFVFSVHLDVVPAEIPSQYTMKRDGDQIYGRGVYDCKGNALCVIEVLCALADKNVSVGCLFGPDEEIGGIGTRWMVEKKGYLPKKMVIVPDGGYGYLRYAHKGQTFVRVRARGRSGHSSAPWACDDSITKVMQAYVKLREEWDRRHPLPKDKWSDVLVPTYVKSDAGALNIIPPEMELILNLRSVNPGAKDELLELIKSISDCEAELIRHSPPVNSDPNHPLMKSLKQSMDAALDKPVKIGRMLAATDARWFAGCGVPIAIIGTRGGGAHSKNEFSYVPSYDEMTKYLIDFLLREAK